MTKQEILDKFNDIDFVYNDSSKHETLSRMLDELLKEQEAVLKRACEVIADTGFDFVCDDLMCDDGWCDEHCDCHGTKAECAERWLKKQVVEGR